jgi:hypothetical protein
MERRFRLCAAGLLAWAALAASEHQGEVTFGGLPVPGATVTATQHDRRFMTVTDSQGVYGFPELTDGEWTITVEMTGFQPAKQDVAVGPQGAGSKWELKLLPLDQIKASVAAAAPPEPVREEVQSNKPEPVEEDLSQRAADGLLINGSMNNGAASPFAQMAAFGNNRNGNNSLYTGGIGVILDNSALDARPFSLTGQDTPKASYSRVTGIATLGGPLRIRHLFRNPAFFFMAYQWTRNNNATTQSALVPSLAERGLASSRTSPPARALLNFYPLPNVVGDTGYNFQIPLVSPTHQDALQSRFNKTIDSKNEIYGRFAFQDTREDNPNLFGFLDTTDVLGINAAANWSRRLSQRWFLNLGVQYSRLSTRVTPYFENRENVSGEAGIAGNDQNAMNWGPPALIFSSGIASLSDAQSSFDRNQTGGVSYSMLWNRGAHNITFGTDFRRQEFNYLSQQNPRGTFTFTGAATGSDFGDFLAGIPDVSSIAFGNADKYLRQSVYDAFVTDDWRIGPELTLNAGLRWEYGSPVTELYGRLVNLDIAPDFTAVSPIVANSYPAPLVRPDRRGIEPRVGIAWRPVSGSSMVIRAGYGIYYDTSVYQNIALQMAQQPPLSKSFSVQNSPADPLTLADGFNASPSITSNTFAIDPNFRIGYAQNWQASLQRELPGSLQMTATYLGIKGTRGPQEFLPNTYPIGAVNPCPACPTGFAYLTSNGNSSRESAQIQLRRRLHNGFTGSMLYTFSKSIDDDAALGGQNTSGFAIAQNWLNLAAERGLSTFDRRHLLSSQVQYTTGMGVAGGMLLTGWRGALLKEWTVATQINAGSGLPETPVYLAPVTGTGFTGTIRPEYTGASLYSAPAGLFLNPAAYVAPASGEWGNAGRDSIRGPAQFTLNASLGRTFRVSDRLNLDVRADSTNALNHVNFTTWNTTINSAQFGSPAAANAMRSTQLTLRLRF